VSSRSDRSKTNRLVPSAGPRRRTHEDSPSGSCTKPSARPARKSNWEPYALTPTGRHPVNLHETSRRPMRCIPTSRPTRPRILLTTDEGRSPEERAASVLRHRRRTASTSRPNAASPAGASTAKSIAYLKGEYERHTTREYATAGLTYYHLDNIGTTAAPNEKHATTSTHLVSHDGKCGRRLQASDGYSAPINRLFRSLRQTRLRPERSGASAAAGPT